MSIDSLELPADELRDPLLRRRRRGPWLPLFIIVLAVVGTGGAYAWLNAGSLVEQFSGRSTADADDKAILVELMAAQQKISEDLAGLDQALATEREQLATIVGRLDELSAKIDALQSAAVTPRAVAPIVAAQPVSTAVQPAPVSQPAPAVASKPKKTARAPRPSGPVSVGGQPLDSTPTPTAQ